MVATTVGCSHVSSIRNPNRYPNVISDFLSFKELHKNYADNLTPKPRRTTSPVSWEWFPEVRTRSISYAITKCILFSRLVRCFFRSVHNDVFRSNLFFFFLSHF